MREVERDEERDGGEDMVIAVEEIIVLDEETRGVGEKRYEWRKMDGM